MRQVWLVVLCAALVSGCSTVIEGRSQEIAVNTTPAGASCTLNREDAPIATIAATPGSVTIQKTKDDIEVVCELDGYQKTATIDESGTAAAVFGNVLIGGAIGLVVDMSTGAQNKYDTPLDIALAPRTDLPAPLPEVASAPLAPLPQMAAPRAQPMGVTVDLRRAENAAERYRVLRQLVADGLVPRERYDEWAQQNEGAFLLVTAEPAFAAAGNKPPAYEGAAEFLRSVAAEKNLKVAEAERQSLFLALMPREGAHAPRQKPPIDAQGLQKWYALLDRVRDDGLVPAERIEAEKAAIGDSLVAAGS